MRLVRPALLLLAMLALAGCGSTPTRYGADLPVAGGEAAGLTGDYARYPAAQQFIDRMAAEHGFDRNELARTLSRAQRQDWIVDLVNRPSGGAATGPTSAWTRYRAKFLTESNIANGAAFWARNEATLRRAEAQYGVPPEAIVGILGVETRWGGYMGKTRILDALATLAFDFPRRSAYFTDELEAYLVMARDEGMDPFRPVGSYAGAMGLGQFMPSSFLKYAVDFDGNGHRNLWDTEDAIGSVANYFAAHGWRRGEPVAVRARNQGGDGAVLKAGFDTRYSPAALHARGISAAGPVPAVGEVSLLRLDAAGGYEYWLGLPNFYVITRYNHSTHYAMAVYQLGQAVRARRGAAIAAGDGGRPASDAGAAPGPAALSAPDGPRLSLR
jgi:membrane-bound lytic murein transglycosylase B